MEFEIIDFNPMQLYINCTDFIQDSYYRYYQYDDITILLCESLSGAYIEVFSKYNKNIIYGLYAIIDGDGSSEDLSEIEQDREYTRFSFSIYTYPGDVLQIMTKFDKYLQLVYQSV